MQDPELPDDPDEHLYFCMVDFNVVNAAEFKKVASMEMSMGVSAEQVKAFTEAGGVFGDGAAAGDIAAMASSGQGMLGMEAGVAVPKAKAGGTKRKRALTNGEDKDDPAKASFALFSSLENLPHSDSLQVVVPDSPVQKAQRLVEKCLRDANACRPSLSASPFLSLVLPLSLPASLPCFPGFLPFCLPSFLPSLPFPCLPGLPSCLPAFMPSCLPSSLLPSLSGTPRSSSSR